MGNNLKIRKRPRSRSTPIACVVCDRVFLDNVSLVLHFECHLNGEVSIPGQHSQGIASLRSSSPLSLNLSSYPCSSAERINLACRRVFPRMNNCFRPSSSPVSSAITPNPTPTDACLAHIPPLNSIPQVNSSFGAQSSVCKPVHHSMVSPYGPSSSSRQLMSPQAGARRFAYGSSTSPHLQLLEQTEGQARFANFKNPHTNHVKKTVPEIIIISDDEEDESKNVDGIDLTLKL